MNKKKLKRLGIFKISDAIKIGVSQPTLSRMVQKGSIIRVARGLYIHPEANIQSEKLEYIAACTKFGKKAYITGITALFHHGLTEQVPNQIWLSVPRNTRTTDTKYNLIRVKRYKSEGVINSKHYKIASIERTLVDSLKYSSKIGIRTVIAAITRAVLEKKTKIENIRKLAKKLNIDKTLSKYWEPIIGSIEGNL